MYKNIALNGIISALYIMLTIINPLSFGIINIRIADFIPVIGVIDKRYRLGVTIGMIISNLFSPFGVVDVFVAIAICLFSFYGTCKARENIRILLLAISTSVLVSCEISILTHIPFVIETLIMLATQIPMCFIGAKTYHKIERVFKNV